ncbi:MAG: Gfo/Idh/MocA family oxidoreductase [Phycisphaerales bacterium]|nr:Gfo/Idh/MocA family oxidoreductase [Phycisphaerales bacterium]
MTQAERMKVLVIGGGSMGRRRMRDLSARGDVSVGLLDLRADRREQAAGKFGVVTFDSLSAALDWHPAALVISTPPDQHADLVELALERGLHHFSEANIWTVDPSHVESISTRKKLVSAASCSMHFLPVVRELKKLLRQELGTLHGYQMLLSTYQPNWHPDEGKEYYARHRATAAAREMVPFELLYLNELFGYPRSVAGTVVQRGNLVEPMEDLWSMQMVLDQGASAQLTVLMGCPIEARRGVCYGDNGMIRFDVMSGQIEREMKNPDVRDTLRLGAIGEVLEEAYRQEIGTFIDAIGQRARWPMPYSLSALSTATLAAAEQSARDGKWQAVDAAIQPQLLPPPMKQDHGITHQSRRQMAKA